MDILSIVIGLTTVIAIIGGATVVAAISLKAEIRTATNQLKPDHRQRRRRGGPAEIDAAIRRWDRLSSLRGWAPWYRDWP